MRRIQGKSTKQLLGVLGPLVLLILFALTVLVRQIQDPDFFWHLKTGEWLWNYRTWPIPDPFSFTTPERLDPRQLFILKGYWLSQLLYYGGYACFGWSGIFLLRIVVFAAFVSVLWKNRQQDNWLWGGFCLLCLVAIFDLFPVERPQFFSFLLFAWLYLLLDRLWSGLESVSWWHVSGVGVGMVLWGNLHGGVFLGQGLLLIILGLDLFRGNRRGESLFSPRPRLWLVALVGVLAGFCNPNAPHMIPMFFQISDTSSLLYAANDEFKSMLKVWQGPNRNLAIYYAVTAATGLTALLTGLRKQSSFTLLIFLGTGIYAALYTRYLPFFFLAALPVIVRGFASISWRWGARGGVWLVALALIGCCLLDERGNINRVSSDGWVSNQEFPVALADHVRATGADGHMFNLYRWGGYLLWRLAPEHRVFVDGRSLSGHLLRDVLTAEMVSFGGGRPLWKEVFQKHSIDYAVLPLVEGGAPYNLTRALMQDSQWRVAFASRNAVMFVRKKPHDG